MSDTPWTKGPWRVGDPDEFGDIAIQPASEQLAVAVLVNGEFRHIVNRTDEHIANGHLIAAAPLMADTLKDDWAEGLWQFLLSEYAARPESGEAVTADIRPLFNRLCDFIAKRRIALSAARGEQQ